MPKRNFFHAGRLPAPAEPFAIRDLFFSRRGEPDSGPTMFAETPEEVVSLDGPAKAAAPSFHDVSRKRKAAMPRTARKPRVGVKRGVSAVEPLAPGVAGLGQEPSFLTKYGKTLAVVGVLGIGAYLYFRKK